MQPEQGLACKCISMGGRLTQRQSEWQLPPSPPLEEARKVPGQLSDIGQQTAQPPVSRCRGTRWGKVKVFPSISHTQIKRYLARKYSYK